MKRFVLSQQTFVYKIYIKNKKIPRGTVYSLSGAATIRDRNAYMRANNAISIYLIWPLIRK